MPCPAFCLKLPKQLPCVSYFTFRQPCAFPAYLVFHSQRRLSCVKYLYDFPLPLLDLCCVILSLSLLKGRWVGGSTAGRAAGDICITDFGLGTLRLRRSAVGLRIEILILEHKYGVCGVLDGPFIFRSTNTHSTLTLTADSIISIR